MIAQRWPVPVEDSEISVLALVSSFRSRMVAESDRSFYLTLASQVSRCLPLLTSQISIALAARADARRRLSAEKIRQHQAHLDLIEVRHQAALTADGILGINTSQLTPQFFQGRLATR